MALFMKSLMKARFFLGSSALLATILALTFTIPKIQIFREEVKKPRVVMEAYLAFRYHRSMTTNDAFAESIQKGYTFQGKSIVLGGAMLEQAVPGLLVKAPLSTMNRHGLIAGATGTGKTKSLQMLVEQLSENGVATIVMDIKGDFSGISQEGVLNDKIKDRSQKIGIPWSPERYPVEFLSISAEQGVRLRSTVSEFGPVLFSKILELNETQQGVVSLIFKYCDDNGLPLLDLKDFKAALQYLNNEGKDAIEREYGAISSASVNTIVRKVIEIEEQGADRFFGELSFEVEDLMRTDSRGYGVVNILRLTDIQNKPKLFSTFMLSLLAEIYQKYPEEGDVEKPKLVFFIDEAHLIFEEASKTLLDEINTTIKLIRSKGIGIFFITQIPTDIPASVLSQLGMKIQHALRAFTAQDRKTIKLTAENYPETPYYQVDTVLTSLGIGEALVTVLDERGAPTPLVRTMMASPRSRMDTVTPEELQMSIRNSQLSMKYNQEIDRQSAYEILQAKIRDGQAPAETGGTQGSGSKSTGNGKSQKDDPSIFEQISKNPIARDVGRTLTREITRGILGVLGIKRRR